MLNRKIKVNKQREIKDNLIKFPLQSMDKATNLYQVIDWYMKNVGMGVTKTTIIRIVNQIEHEMKGQ